MAILQYKNVGITAMAACVPHTVIDNYKYTQYFSEEEVRKVVDKVGIYERRFADSNTCSSDLCCAAAEKLIADNHIDRSEIDLLVFVSQTPDYRMPATSIILQERLKLNNSVIAFDINLGCSGFLYGLSTVYSFMQQKGLRKALLLDGETRSKVYSPKDRRSAFLFGDAGVAALIERNEKFGNSYFSLNSDGSRADLIMIKGGGYRHPSSLDTLKERVVDEFGNIRSDEQGYMKGADVFNFVIVEIPKDIKRLFQFAGMEKEQMDYFVFHQANDFINSYIAKKLKLDTERIPSTIHKYGNTSSVSVPLTIVSELKSQLEEADKTLMLSAFGVGLTWGTAIVPFSGCHISDVVEL
ncbi:ketoacyl-ACP synthase III [Bacteroides intestinalis]|jgi:3-oxoacyl-[acyl-carrier-protein] synthase-3|uniref:Ketoacyl-ACP synthase III n=1 Tax=Bacteroides intestinalis TaxID=329854 RepID=A0A415N781_9BACE|nr:ketoacyl-ACP synthase III [Bacteroides intestinalis]RHL91594.1 ketoacyl-ACP synthase III [Bacteroides intestinalis]